MTLNTIVRALTLKLALLLAVALVTPVVAAAEPWLRDVPVAESGRFNIDLDFGSVRVVSHAARSAQIVAEARGLGASEYRFALVREGDDLRLTGRAAAWVSLMAMTPDIQLDVRIPAGYSVEVATDRGSVSVTSVSGATVRSRAGTVAVRDIRGEVNIETREGAVEIDGVSGEVSANVQDAPIHARFDRTPSGWLRASGGAVDIALRPGVGAQLDARAPGGCVFIENRIHAGCGAANLPVVLPINGGGSTLQVRARRGDIRMHTESF